LHNSLVKAGQCYGSFLTASCFNTVESNYINVLRHMLCCAKEPKKPTQCNDNILQTYLCKCFSSNFWMPLYELSMEWPSFFKPYSTHSWMIYRHVICTMLWSWFTLFKFSYVRLELLMTLVTGLNTILMKTSSQLMHANRVYKLFNLSIFKMLARWL